MSFEFILSTNEIREKMFNYIQPIYKGTMDFDVAYINWLYGVYDSESGLFITYVNSEKDNAKYILIKEDKVFYVIGNRYRHIISEIAAELENYRDVVQEGIILYNNEKKKKLFKGNFSDEQEKKFSIITENMKDRCRPSFTINCYEDAEKLFYKDNFNYYNISHLYNKSTITNFDKYMSERKMCVIRGEKYRNILSKISAYGNTLDKEEYAQISKDFRDANYLFGKGIDDIYVEITFEAIEKAYKCGVVSWGYVEFIDNYLKKCIKSYADKLKSIRPVLDFINKNMKGECFGSLDLCRKELNKLIYGKIEGFHFILTTDKIREKMFDFLKPKYKMVDDKDVTHINWTTGVYDKKSGIFLTKIYYLSDGLARCGVNFHSYIVIMDKGYVFRVDNDDEYEKKTYKFKIPEQYEKFTLKIKEGIEFYKYKRDYLDMLCEGTEKQLKVIENMMDDRCHLEFLIDFEDDAKNLFWKRNCNVNTIFGMYNKKTISDFNKYATPDKLLIWRGERYLQLLYEVRSTNITDEERCQVFKNACYFLWYGINDTYDSEFLITVKYMYNACLMEDRCEDALRSYINTYVDEYSNKLMNIVPLIRFIKTRTEGRQLKEVVAKVEKIINKSMG